MTPERSEKKSYYPTWEKATRKNTKLLENPSQMIGRLEGCQATTESAVRNAAAEKSAHADARL
jgi:hypothetical protein